MWQDHRCVATHHRWYVYNEARLKRPPYVIRSLTSGLGCGFQTLNFHEGHSRGLGPTGFPSVGVFRALVDGGITNGLSQMLYHTCAVLEETHESNDAVRRLLSVLGSQHLFNLFCDGSSCNPWHGCIASGREVMCRAFLQLASELLDATDDRGYTPLMSAIVYMPSGAAATAEGEANMRRRQRMLQMLLNVTLADEVSLEVNVPMVPAAAATGGDGLGKLDVFPLELQLHVLRCYVGSRSAGSMRARATLRQVSRAGFALARSSELGARLAVERRSRLGETSLHLLARLENTQLALGALAQLRRAGASVHAKDATGRSVLSHACAFGRPTLVQELLRCGVSQGADADGFTPLHDVCDNAPISQTTQRQPAGQPVLDSRLEQFAECARLLLTNGADSLSETRWGKRPDLTALGLAVDSCVDWSAPSLMTAAATPPDASLHERVHDRHAERTTRNRRRRYPRSDAAQLAPYLLDAQPAAGVAAEEDNTLKQDALLTLWLEHVVAEDLEVATPEAVPVRLPSAEWQPPPQRPAHDGRRAIERLKGLGFDEQAAIQALAHSKGDVDQAAASLFEL